MDTKNSFVVCFDVNFKQLKSLLMHLKCRPHQEMQTYIFYEFDTQLLRLEVHAY